MSFIFGLLGIYLFARGLIVVSEAWESRSWPTAAGTIIESRVEKTRVRRGYSFTPMIACRYEVGAETLTNSRIRIVDQIWTRNAEAAAALVDRYPAGRNISVAYDPQKHDKSVLEPGPWKGSYLNLVGGFGFALFGGLFALPSGRWAGSRPRLAAVVPIAAAAMWMAVMAWLLTS